MDSSLNIQTLYIYTETHIMIPFNTNPTQLEIDNFIHDSNNSEEITRIVREINAKEGVGALLHPIEEYFRNKIIYQ